MFGSLVTNLRQYWIPSAAFGSVTILVLCAVFVSVAPNPGHSATNPDSLTARQPSASNEQSRLEHIAERGRLIMLTRNSASSYFVDGKGETGPEYVMANGLAKRLGVDLEVRVADSFQQLTALLASGEGDMIAANMTKTPVRERQFRFSIEYANTHTVVVYRKSLRQPESLADLVGLRGAVLASSSYEEILLDHAQTHPELTWGTRTALGVEGLLHAVAEGEIEYTLVDERIFQLHKRFYPNVREAFEIGEGQSLAWAFERDNDDTLTQAANSYLLQARESGALASIRDRFFQPETQMGQLDMLHFQRRMKNRLPPFLPLFQEAAINFDLDWRLLAAMGYQESHWDPLAASPTGVRGLMMLTLDTAASLGLDDRLDPLQSIHGGAEYLVQMRARLPARIQEPDRTFLALAAYNIGFGHLEDARRLTEAQGGNPDTWQDVSQRLPLLTQERYYRDTRYGYARGYEALHYVNNIRRFHKTLIWMETRSHPLLAAQILTAP